MPTRKVLIITYYWPPCGGSGVQRWLKFVKYLVRLGWEPIVYTPENPSFGIRDESLLKDVPPEVEVIKLPIWEPYETFFKLSKLAGGKKPAQSDFVTTQKKSLLQKIAGWVRGNFFIPDARVFWVKPSVTFLTDFLQSNQIETVITTGPPHSMHLIGLKLKKKNPTLKWIADFRDPWSEWDLLDTFSLSGLARNLHKRQERAVLTQASRVITIAPYHVERLKALSGRQVDLITNGFDEEDFAGITHAPTDKFTLRHIGMVDELRDPMPLMAVIRELCLQREAFAQSVRVEFIGNVNSAFKNLVNEDLVLMKVVTFIDPIPHAELLRLYGSTDLQLLVLAYTAIAPGNLPGKFFEYLASGNSILAIGPVQGDAARVLHETKAGEIFERNDAAGMRASLIHSFEAWKNRKPSSARDVSRYTRKNLTHQLIALLEGA